MDKSRVHWVRDAEGSHSHAADTLRADARVEHSHKGPAARQSDRVHTYDEMYRVVAGKGSAEVWDCS